MTPEPTPILPIFGFVITGLLAARVIIKYNIQASHAFLRLKKASELAGMSDDLSASPFRKISFCINPEKIRAETDPEEVKAAKEEMILCAKKLPSCLIRAWTVLGIGMVITVALGILEFYIRK